MNMFLRELIRCLLIFILYYISNFFGNSWYDSAALFDLDSWCSVSLCILLFLNVKLNFGNIDIYYLSSEMRVGSF